MNSTNQTYGNITNTTPQNVTPGNISNYTVNHNTSENQYISPEKSPSSTQKSNLTVHFIDVGQEDSILVEYANETILIDSGKSDKTANVSAFLREQGVSSLDFVIWTNPRADHIDSIMEILNEYPVKEFVDSGYLYTNKTYETLLSIIENKSIQYHSAKRGEALNFASDIQVQVLNPPKKLFEDTNENSVILRLVDNNVSFLLMGNAGLEAEESIMYEGYYVESDILKVGRHANSSGKEFIEEVNPDISIIEARSDNEYVYPNSETLQRLQNTSTVYRTDLYGTITVTTNGLTYAVTTEKNPLEQDRTNTTVSYPSIKVRENSK
ncbi:ComEC/Rec2 family competence protein [uncultured Methanomethylovorans sp.]|uniref:ComEC/Rec2 family competence protein n=1 Tax=uncultured Methanomethylovorans sp. TaxID=183759 RepID=UPI00374A6D48